MSYASFSLPSTRPNAKTKLSFKNPQISRIQKSDLSLSTSDTVEVVQSAGIYGRFGSFVLSEQIFSHRSSKPVEECSICSER